MGFEHHGVVEILYFDSFWAS